MEPTDVSSWKTSRRTIGPFSDDGSYFDKNGDGRLLREEVPPRLTKAFERLDRDGDKMLTLDELARAFDGRGR